MKVEKNKNYQITPSELKKFDGFENISDNEAIETCMQIKELSLILYDIFQSSPENTIDEKNMLPPD